MMKCREVGSRECGEEVVKVQRYIVRECTNDVCGTRRVGEERNNGNEWWNEEVGGPVAEERIAFEKWLPRRDMVTYERYWAQRVVVKRAVKVAKTNGGLAMNSNLRMISRATKNVLERGKASEER